MYDRNTFSLWSQVLGQAIAGPLKRTRLLQIPSTLTTWESWKARHPGTLVLVKRADLDSLYVQYHRSSSRIGIAGSDNPDSRLPGKALVYGMTFSERFVAVPFSLLESNPVLNTMVFGTAVAVFSPPGENTAMAFERTVDGKTLTFERVESDDRLGVRDAETGSTWSWESGECFQGPFRGKHLNRITSLTVYWAIWARFHPGTEVMGPGHLKSANE